MRKTMVKILLALITASIIGCTKYQARLEVPILAPDGITVVATKVYTMDMEYFAQDKAVKSFGFDPVTGKITLENFGSRTSQAIEAALEKIPIP